MRMDLKPGSRWKSAVCEAQMVVGRPPSTVGELQCGGAAVIPIDDGAAPTGEVSPDFAEGVAIGRSEEHTSELQSLMRISYAVFCLKKKKPTPLHTVVDTFPHTSSDKQIYDPQMLSPYTLQHIDNT